MTQSKKIILLTISLILTICLMAFFGVYALTTLKNSTFNVGVKYEPEYLVKVEMWIDGANGGTVNQTIEENEYVEIFNSLNPVSNGMYIDSMSNETIRINSQTLKPIGANGDVYFRITSLENETSGNKDLKCVIDCGSSTVDSGILAINISKELTIETGIDATNGTPTSSSLGMIKISLKFSEFLLDLKYLIGNDATGLNFGELGIVASSDITGKTFYVSDIDGLLTLSALSGQVKTTTTEYGSNCGYDNSAGPAVTFKGATIQMLNDIDCGNKNNFSQTFISIGNETNSFQGTFDGNNKTITGLYINQKTDNAGLFGYVEKAEIKNLTMQNCKVVSTGEYVGNFVGSANGVIISNCSAEKTEVNGSSRVGGIVGFVEGRATITNCYNTGSVSGSSYDVGGIVGDVHPRGVATITNCYNTGSVSGNYETGGIVGCVFADGRAIITNCYNTGSVSGTSSSDNVGGIVGFVQRTATITNCYNTGSVTGYQYSGGIVGYVERTATITNCYNTGSVIGDYVGGIVGAVERTATITNCYYLKTSSVNASLNGVGFKEGTLTSTSYFGTFSSAESGLTKCSDSPSELAYGTSNLITVLNAYVNDNPIYTDETSGLEIELTTWEIRAGENDGYPVFVITETVA